MYVQETVNGQKYTQRKMQADQNVFGGTKIYTAKKNKQANGKRGK